MQLAKISLTSWRHRLPPSAENPERRAATKRLEQPLRERQHSPRTRAATADAPSTDPTIWLNDHAWTNLTLDMAAGARDGGRDRD